MTSTAVAAAHPLRRRASAHAVPGMVLGAWILALWLLGGVSLGQIALFAGYQLAFVGLPGCLAYAALSGRGGWLRRVAIGWAVGYVLEILAFMLTAAVGARGLFWLYPVVVCGVAIGALTRSRMGAGCSWRLNPGFEVSPGWSWALAAMGALVLAYLALAYFTQTPLPGSFARGSYFEDLVFNLSLAAEAKHHWPMSDPKVAGAPLRYYTFVNMDMAATSQVTGIALPIVLFRLYLVPMVLLVVAQLGEAGRAIFRNRWVGLVAAGLALLVGELDLDPHQALVFDNTFFASLYDSPSFLLGLVFFLPALILIVERSAERLRRPGEWVLLTLLLVGCAGAKAMIIPVLLGGGVIWMASRLLRRDSGRGGLLLGLAIAAGAFATFYRLQYGGGRAAGLALDPPGTVAAMRPIVLAAKHVPELLEPPFWVGAVVVGLLGFASAPLAGLALGGRAFACAPGSARWFLWGLLLAGLAPFLLISQSGESQNFFAYYGYAAACLLSAEGIVIAWKRHARPLSIRAGLAALGWLVVLLILAFALAGSGGQPQDLSRYCVWLAAIALVVASLLLLAWRASGRRGSLVAAAMAAIVLAGLLDTPLDVAPNLVARARAGAPLYSQAGNGLTVGLYRGLAWTRDHTPTKSVIAADNYYLAPGHDPGYVYYSAFAERRIFLEGWGYALRSSSLGYAAVLAGTKIPYPRRLALNEAVFRHADRAALRILVNDYGVRYLVADRVNGGPTAQLGRLGRLVFSNPDIDVYAVGAEHLR